MATCDNGNDNRVFPYYTKLATLSFLYYLKLEIRNIQFLVTSILIRNTMTNRSVYKIFFIWQLFPIYFHLKLFKSANFPNFGY